jgi:hypothetical protein
LLLQEEVAAVVLVVVALEGIKNQQLLLLQQLHIL